MLQAVFKRDEANPLLSTGDHPAEERHHRLLEGTLLRLGRSPDAERFILRGGMLLRLWFRPLPRPAADLDLVSTDAFNVDQTARRFLRVLAERDVDDGVVFDTKRFRADAIWQDTDFPGVRMFAAAQVDGIEHDFNVDVTFGEPLTPAPQLGEYPMSCTNLTTRIWMCRPETIVGRKLHALMHMRMQHWRPKDLNDLRLLLGRMPMNVADLAEGIAASFRSRGNRPAEARGLFARPWWTRKTSAARWHDFVRATAGQDMPQDLANVVAEVAGRLEPILERLP